MPAFEPEGDIGRASPKPAARAAHSYAGSIFEAAQRR
jgi:hypothetical protein